MSTDRTECSSGCAVTVHVREARTGGSHHTVKLPGQLRHSSIVSASGRHLLVNAPENEPQRLLVLDIKPASSAGLWGSLLWQPEGDEGVVAATDLRTGQITRRVDLGSGCRPYELQADGDWFYSACSSDGAGAAAYHVPSGQRLPLSFVSERPLGSVQLGDGSVIQHNQGLNVYNLRSGKAEREHQAEGHVGGCSLGWAVDRFGAVRPTSTGTRRLTSSESPALPPRSRRSTRTFPDLRRQEPERPTGPLEADRAKQDLGCLCRPAQRR
ncbi:hypothetical protein AB0I68_38850 [Streptomyces sp. NPDC050448]|uniref:hypothetical protein n=1 Tax=Streptomyces sp. NPDC050448 TaxID=3155404 RepID=UPI00343DC4BA